MKQSKRAAGPDENEIQDTMRTVAHAIAREKHGGRLNVSDQTLADLYRAAEGEIKIGDVTCRIYQRLEKKPEPM